jgi:hypothetical protein
MSDDTTYLNPVTGEVSDVSEVSTALAVVDDDPVVGAIQSIASGQALTYSSFVGNDWATKLAQLQAVTNSEPLRDHFNEPIPVKNIVIQAVDMEDERTHVVSKQPRIILLDGENNAYHCISQGALKSVGNIIGIMGDPSTWNGETVGIIAKEKPGKLGRYITLEIANTIKLPKK